jgi:hypothetical protein
MEGTENIYYVQDLLARYKLKTRQSLYTRVKQTNLKWKKIGGKSYLEQKDVDILDQLHTHLQTGGKTELFMMIRDSTLHKQKTNSTSNYNPLLHWDLLYRAATRDYILSSTEITNILGFEPDKDRIVIGAFKIQCSGTIGKEKAFRVFLNETHSV